MDMFRRLSVSFLSPSVNSNSLFRVTDVLSSLLQMDVGVDEPKSNYAVSAIGKGSGSLGAPSAGGPEGGTHLGRWIFARGIE
jgi:hypothetical protein